MNETVEKKIGAKEWGILLLLALIWGSSFILMKRGLEAYSSTQVASLRIFLTTLAMLPFLLTGFRKIRRQDLLPLFIVAVAGNGIPPFLFTAAQVHISSAAAGVLNSLTPIFVLLFGILFFKMAFKWNRLFGVALGFMGAASLILFSTPQSTVVQNEYFYGLFIIGASLCYAVSVNMVKTYCQHIHPITINLAVFLMVGPFAGVYLFSTDFVTLLQTHPLGWSSFGYIVILAVFGTAIATVIFFQLTQKTDALFASTVTYLIPIVAVFWGLMDGETIGWTYAIGLVGILGGVYLARQ